MKIITNDNGQQYKTPGFWPTAGAVIAGNMAGNVVRQTIGSFSKPILNEMKETSKSIDNKILRQAIADAFENSGLKEKGIEILDVKPTSEFKIPNFLKPFHNRPFSEGGGAQLRQPFSAALSESGQVIPEANQKLAESISKEMPGWFRNTYLGKLYRKILQNTFEHGNNAAFFPKTNKIGVNIEKLGASTFHEMGHAINRNMSTFWKGMQKLRAPAMITGSVLSLTALIKRKKVEGEQPKNKLDKATTFIKNNVGKLVSLSFVPIVAEELMASYRGNKMAKSFLPAEMFKKVRKTNALGAITYISAGIGAGLAAFVASKVRDEIAEPKKVRHPRRTTDKQYETNSTKSV